MNSVKRPPVVWIAQILLAVFTALLLFTVVFDLALVIIHLGTSSVLPAFIVLAVLMIIAIFFAGSFWGMVKAKPYGRWLGLSSLILVWAFIIFAQVRPSEGPFKRFEYDNAAQVAGAVIAQILLNGLFLLLIVRLAFARKVGEFFRQDAT